MSTAVIPAPNKFVKKTDIVNNLTSTATDKPGSANMLRYLHDDASQALTRSNGTDVDELYDESGRVGFYSASYISPHLPTNAWYFIISFRGETNYISQLAIGMTDAGVYYRRYNIGDVGTSWTQLT